MSRGGCIPCFVQDSPPKKQMYPICSQLFASTPALKKQKGAIRFSYNGYIIYITSL